MKQVRKEEKKLQKVVSKLDSYDDQELNFKKQKAIAARSEPLFKKNKTIILNTVPDSYPFVFDSKLKAKATAGALLIQI